MGFQPAPNILKVEFVYWNGSNISENVLHYEYTSEPNQATLESFGLALRTWWASNLKDDFPNTMFLNKIILKDIAVQNGIGIEYTAGMPLPGDATSPVLPSNVTVAVKLTTGLVGRSSRGRIYHVGLKEENVIGDMIDSPFAVALQGFYEELLTVKIDPLDVGWVVLSRWTGLLPRLFAVGTKIIGVSVDQTVDSQRRRLAGRGK